VPVHWRRAQKPGHCQLQHPQVPSGWLFGQAWGVQRGSTGRPVSIEIRSNLNGRIPVRPSLPREARGGSAVCIALPAGAGALPYEHSLVQLLCAPVANVLLRLVIAEIVPIAIAGCYRLLALLRYDPPGLQLALLLCDPLQPLDRIRPECGTLTLHIHVPGTHSMQSPTDASAASAQASRPSTPRTVVYRWEYCRSAPRVHDFARNTAGATDGRKGSGMPLAQAASCAYPIAQPSSGCVATWQAI
jgi:hypothetical protein